MDSTRDFTESICAKPAASDEAERFVFKPEGCNVVDSARLGPPYPLQIMNGLGEVGIPSLCWHQMCLSTNHSDSILF